MTIKLVFVASPLSTHAHGETTNHYTTKYGEFMLYGNGEKNYDHENESKMGMKRLT